MDEEKKTLIAVMRLIMDRFATSERKATDAQRWDSFCDKGEVFEIRDVLAEYGITPVLSVTQESLRKHQD